MFRIRFRLITLLAAMTLIAIGAAAYGMHRRAVLAEHNALVKIATKGGWVIKSTGGGVIVEFFAQKPPQPPILSCGTGVERVYLPTGNGAEFTDADLALFNDVRELNYVRFQGTKTSVTAQQEFRRKHPHCHFDD